MTSVLGMLARANPGGVVLNTRHEILVSELRNLEPANTSLPSGASTIDALRNNNEML